MKTQLVRTWTSANLATGLSSSKTDTAASELSFNVRDSGLKDKFTKVVKSKFPIFSWSKTYGIDKLILDVIAGITVSLTILPQGLAYASVAHLEKQTGLYASFMGSFIYIFLGSVMEIKIGPTAILAIMTYTYGKRFAVLLSLAMGIITLMMGILQFGFVVNFISRPVMSGFTSAAAITIASTQLKELFGIRYDSDGIVDLIGGFIRHIHKINWGDSLLSLATFAFLLFFQNLPLILKKIFGELSEKTSYAVKLISAARSAVVICLWTAMIFFWKGPEGNEFNVVDELQSGLPQFSIPYISFDGGLCSLQDFFKNCSSALVVMPLLAIMEHVTSAKCGDGGKRVDANQELIALGLTNIANSFFGGLATTGSLSLTTVNKASGAKTPLGGLLTGVLVLVSLQCLMPVFAKIPMAGLGAVIVYAVAGMIDFGIVIPMWKTKRSDVVAWGGTFFVSLFVGLPWGILVGAVISVFYLLFYAARPGIRVKSGTTTKGSEFILVDLDRSLVFPSIDYTMYIVKKCGRTYARHYLPVVIHCQHIQFADFTAAEGLRDLFVEFNQRGQALLLMRAKPSVVRILTGLLSYSSTPFIICESEQELETELDALNIPRETPIALMDTAEERERKISKVSINVSESESDYEFN